MRLQACEQLRELQKVHALARTDAGREQVLNLLILLVQKYKN
jgi:hypothetical protein